MPRIRTNSDLDAFIVSQRYAPEHYASKPRHTRTQPDIATAIYGGVNPSQLSAQNFPAVVRRKRTRRTLRSADVDTTKKHCTPEEVAALLSKSPDYVIKHFKNMAGVIVLGEGSRREGKRLVRRYQPLLIPASVLQKWLAQKTNR